MAAGYVKLLCVNLSIIWLVLGANNNYNVEAAGVTCNLVLRSISSCVGYVTHGGAVPPSCCDGVKSLNNAAGTTPDLQATCRCLKTIASNLKNVNPSLVNSLPGICHVNFPYKYSPSLDCSKLIR